MKSIKIGDMVLEVLNCYAYQYQSGKRELRMTILQEEIGYSDLKELLKSSSGEIILTDEDGNTQTFSGYKNSFTITDKTEDNGEEIFDITIDCVGEAERKALESVAKAKEIQEQADILKQTIQAQEMRIEEMVENEADLLYELSLMQLGIE